MLSGRRSSFFSHARFFSSHISDGSSAVAEGLSTIPPKRRRIFTRRNLLKAGLLALAVGPPWILYHATDPEEQTPFRYGKWQVSYASKAEGTPLLCLLYASAAPSAAEYQQSFSCQLCRVDTHDTRGNKLPPPK